MGPSCNPHRRGLDDGPTDRRVIHPRGGLDDSPRDRRLIHLGPWDRRLIPLWGDYTTVPLDRHVILRITRRTHFLHQPAATSLLKYGQAAIAVAVAVVPSPPLSWCGRVYSSSKKSKQDYMKSPSMKIHQEFKMPYDRRDRDGSPWVGRLAPVGGGGEAPGDRGMRPAPVGGHRPPGTRGWRLAPLCAHVNETMEHSKKGRARRKNPMDPTIDGKRRTTIMKRVHMARKRGERIQVTFDEKGQPEGKHGDELMSWIGVLAREHVSIWIQDWRSRDLNGLKDIIWKETVTSFTVDESFRTTCLQSCGEAARNFRYDLYKTFVEEYLNEESVWTRPQKVIDNYSNIEEDDWMKFVQYRTSSQFQHLSNRGSEIRTNNEYLSREGRDGYRKLDQEMTAADGELKDPACQKVSELIMEYNTQESQGTFESVGTNDVLSQALSRPEHKGRVRGQSKFVKPSQYFNLNRSSSKDNEVLSIRREIEELKALVRGLCAKKDVELSVDPNNVPTVDQHNSFKASCYAQEKQHGVFDPPTMPVDNQECKLYIFDEV
ncbi:hypothetical protein TIFTF001_043251 [Ficus carica]|uniref:Transposase n=1 Tax=Ficus carica TaxID=3494 RepID=A0AA88CI21_FICCA|nr:hypothetical protein TIFTF001_043251 [Ficus carica]